MQRGFTVRALVCFGDKTTYGEVISATATWFEGNKAIAQTGDLALCSKCKGTFPIYGTASDWSEQQPYVATGDRVLCGCPDHVVYGSATQYTTVASNSMPASTQSRSVNAPAPSPAGGAMPPAATPLPKHYARQFSVVDSETGSPLAHREYVARVDGKVITGTTDSLGIATVEARSSDSEISLHVVFCSPVRALDEFKGEQS